MRVVVLGTGPFAVPTLEALLASRHSVAALVTRPARPVHGKSPAAANPMRAVAEARGLVVLAPESINAAEAVAALAQLQPELLVVCDYGQILRPATLAVAPHGGINLHGSLLPKYRGAAPINWAIYHGERETGVTVIHMTAELDAGPALAQARSPIGLDETAVDVEPRLARLGAPLVLEVIEALAAGQVRPVPQDAAQASRAPRLVKTDGLVDWRRPATALRNQVRALVPWPKTYTYWLGPAGEPPRLILDRVRGEPRAQPAAPGTIVEAAGERLVVATGQDALAVEALQPAGKRSMTAAEFMRGHDVRVGQRFGNLPAP